MFKCNRCKKKFNYKKDRIPHIETKEYCKECYERVSWEKRCERETKKEKGKKKKVKPTLINLWAFKK